MAREIFNRSRVLLVEDDEVNRALLVPWLVSLGHMPVPAENVQSARELLDTHVFDLVILDIVLPDGTGFDVLEYIRAKHTGLNLPVIMLTAQDKSDDIIHSFRLGANDFARKPVDLDLLASRISTHLAHKAGSTRQIANFAIDRKLGAGGMGVVYAATHKLSGDHVALKVLHRSMAIDDDYVARFMRETQLASMVQHPNVVGVIDAGRWEETYYLALELVEGHNLFDMVENDRIPFAQVADIGIQITHGLEAIHKLGIIHRDIKPENILVTPAGVAKISDFGIARETMTDERLTDPGVGFGSIAYISPEQMIGEGDITSDFYSLGATLFFAAAGADPFPSDQPPTVVYNLKSKGRPKLTDKVSDAPPRLATLLGKMMDPTPAKRVQSHREIIEELSAIKASLSA